MTGPSGRTRLSVWLLVLVVLSTVIGSVAASAPAAGSSDAAELTAGGASPSSGVSNSTHEVGGDGTATVWNGGRSIAPSSTATFDFESGVSGGSYGDGDVAQTVDGVTVTFSASGIDTNQEHYAGYPPVFSGSYFASTDYYTTSSATITFDEPVDITAISLGDPMGMAMGYRWTLTPDGGNSQITPDVDPYMGERVTGLSWTGVTQIDISAPYAVISVDDIDFAPSVTNARPSFGGGDSATLTVDEDAGATDVTGLLTASDSDDDDLTWSVDSAPAHGSLGGFPATQTGTTSDGVDPSGPTYEPDADYAGADSFDVNVSDGNGGADTITVDVSVRDAPEIGSIDRASSSPTDATGVDFDVAFSEPVSNVDPEDFVVTGVSGDVSGNVGSVSSAVGSTVTVTVSGVTGDGDLRLDLSDDDSITNADGVPLGGVGTGAAGDGGFTGGQTYAVDTTDPTFGSSDTVSFAENGAGTVLDVQADDDAGSDYDTDVTYSLVGGADRSAFGIDANTGALTFDTAPDFEAPADAGEGNDYVVEVRATDDVGNAVTDTVTVTVTDVDERPTFSSVTSAHIDDTASNGASVIDVNATVGGDVDRGVSYAITGGNTGSAFDVDPGTGEITVADSGAFEHTFEFTLTVEASEGTRATTQTVTVTIDDTTAPTANAGSDRTVDEDTSVVFDGSGSTDNVGITSYEWNFGDGSKNATGVSTGHTFGDPGSYTVTFTTTDAAGNSDADTLVVTVADVTAPTADAGSDQTVDEDTKVIFDGSNSSDNVGVTAYVWDFGDGSNASGVSPGHVYAEPGRYAVTLNVTDGAANADSDTAVVTVRDVTAPVAEAGPDRTVKKHDRVRFDATNSTDNVGITSYDWTFGDDSTATGATVDHRYRYRGAYTVNLTVTDAAGNTHDDSLVVTVERRRGKRGGSDGDDSDGDADSVDGEGTYRVGVSRSSTGSDRSTVRVENAVAGSTVDVTSDADEPMDAADGGANVSVSNLEVVVERGGSFDLNVTVEERPDEVFEGTTGSVPVGRVTVDHTIADDDIGGVTFTFGIRVAHLDRLGIDPGSVTLYRLHDGEYRALETSLVGEVGDRYVFRADSPGLSQFTIGVAPARTAVDTASVDAEHLSVGDGVTLTAVVGNDGGMAGTHALDVSIDGEVVATRSVTVAAGETTTVEQTLDLAAGRHVVAVDGLDAGTVVVERREPAATEPPQATTDVGSESDSGLPLVWLVPALLVGLGVAGVALRRRAA